MTPEHEQKNTVSLAAAGVLALLLVAASRDPKVLEYFHAIATDVQTHPMNTLEALGIGGIGAYFITRPPHTRRK